VITLPDDLLAWVAEVGGGPVVHADRQPGGARKEAWFVELAGAGPLFLRFDRSDPSRTKDPWTLHREATVYLALQGTEVLVPQVLAVHPTYQAMLSERVSGQNWFSRIKDPAEQEALARHFMTQLAALHRLDPRRLDLPRFPAPSSIPDMVAWELDEWDRIIEARGGDPGPQLAFALAWLRRNIPDVDGPVVLVQGDTGPGNFMYEGARVVAVVDWELAHLGDPMDDIAWLALRCTQEPFPDFPARLREYEELSGNVIDERRVRYYEVMAETKLLVMRHGASHAEGGGGGEGGGGDIGNGLIYSMLHRRMWFEAIGSFLGLALDPPAVAPTAEQGEQDHLYGVVLDQLRDVVVPRITDPLALQRSKGFARILKYLREVSRYGRFYDEGELDDAAALLGERPATVTDARAALATGVTAGRIAEADYLQVLWRRAARDNELLRPSAGVLADRHWPALR
jgi:aminoglycoside phosphotransferase (APT) family kinase protein